MKQLFAKLNLIALLSSALVGQTPEPPPAFEVADIHASAPGSSLRGGFAPGGRFELRGATMLDLISIAYGVDNDLVIGGPGWLNTNRFDVIAKASTSASQDKLQAMLQALLADRFSLVIHHEQKDMPVYALLVAKSGKLQAAANPGKPESSRIDGDPNVNNHRTCRSFTMADLAALLPRIATNYLPHPVVDMTGLTGTYDFQLDWMGIGPYRLAKANPDGPKPVSIFDAIDKLGLKLEEQKKSTPVIAVAGVNETPTANVAGVAKKIPDVPTEFDVAEVRPSKPGGTPQGRIQNGRVDLMGTTLQDLISTAYDVDDSRIAGGPPWLDKDLFDIIAKAPASVPFDVLQGMLKTLIIQRFKLAEHTEDRPVAVFALALGKRSPKLKETSGSARSECKMVVDEKGRTFVCRNTTMAQLAERLPPVAAAYIIHPMVDLTGLTGAYDFDLSWTPKRGLSTPGAKPVDGQAIPEAAAPAGDLTVFEAVDKQLGLQLKEQKYPMPVIVIDHADRTPSEN